MKDSLPRAPEWIPESEFRDTLLVQKLPAALREKNFFWINVRQYLTSDDAQLAPEDYLRHWQEIYECCLSDDLSRLRRVSYLSFEGPRQNDVH
ncbi:MAG: hypothetical protein ABSG52_09515 [Terriglobales bacterium]|jgi:hypothetical protein